jgi:hypothetical protein
MQLDLVVSSAPVASLVPYAENARTHSPSQVAQIAASIAEFGFVNPVLVDAEGVLIGGHGRVMAAKQLGLASVPLLRLGHLSPAQARALRLADNQIALNSGWDEALLAAEIARIRDEAVVDLDVLGFSGMELDRLLAAADAGLGDDADDAPPPPVVPVTRTGDLWRCGEHRLLCGDAAAGEPDCSGIEGSVPDTAPTVAPAGEPAAQDATVAEAAQAAPLTEEIAMLDQVLAARAAAPRTNLRDAAAAVLAAWDDEANRATDMIAALDAPMEALRTLLAGKPARIAGEAGAPRKPREGTKQEQVLAMLRRPEGATIAQIAEATGWAQHTVRGFFAGLKKKGHAVEVMSRERMVGPNKTGAKGSFTIYHLPA